VTTLPLSITIPNPASRPCRPHRAAAPPRRAPARSRRSPRPVAGELPCRIQPRPIPGLHRQNRLRGAAGVELPVRHLAELGHTRVAHIAGPVTTSTGVTRARAFRAAVRDLGLDDDPALITSTPTWSESAGADGLRRLLDDGVGFTGVFAGNDLIALGCYDVFLERGIERPEQISVVGSTTCRSSTSCARR
jgi:hypothetical protein